MMDWLAAAVSLLRVVMMSTPRSSCASLSYSEECELAHAVCAELRTLMDSTSAKMHFIRSDLDARRCLTKITTGSVSAPEMTSGSRSQSTEEYALNSDILKIDIFLMNISTSLDYLNNQ
jgi:hypothetical protein